MAVGASKADQKEYFTLLYSAFVKKMETVDFSNWIKSTLGQEFRSIGLEPPKKVGQTQYQQEVRRITELLNGVTNEL